MTIPRRGDPRRPLQLAVRSCPVLGVLAPLGSTCAVGPLFVGGGRRSGDPMEVIGVVMSLLLYGGVGAAYLVFAHHMQRRRTWAVVAALSLTGIGLLFISPGTLTMAVMLLAGVFKLPGNTGSFTGIMWGSVAFEAVIAAALGQLVCWLARSFPDLRTRLALGEARGFNVVPMAGVQREGSGPEDGDARA